MPIDPVLLKEVRRLMKHQPELVLNEEQQKVKEWILKRRDYERKYCREIINTKSRKRAIVKEIELEAKTNPERLKNLTNEEKEIYEYVMNLRKNERIANAKYRERKKAQKQQVINVDKLTNYMDNYIEEKHGRNEAGSEAESDAESEAESDAESEAESEPDLDSENELKKLTKTNI
jgi:DNA replication initiation complex subunit (GINS family)